MSDVTGPGTMFPALDGSDPGEKDPGQDISGSRLPSTTDPPTDADNPLWGALQAEPKQSAEQLLGMEDEPNTSPSSPPGIEGQETAPRRSSLQSRIDRLVRRRNEAETRNDALAQQLNQVTAQLSQTQQQLAQLAANRAPSTPVQVQADPTIDGTTPAPQPAPQQLTADQIAAIVQQQIQPLYQQQQVVTQAQQLRSAHEASFAQAVDEFPDLQKPNSKFRQLFNQLYDSSPLKVLQDAPYQLALQAQGLLSTERRDAASSSQRKIAAGVHTPVPAATDSVAGPTDVSKRKDVQTALAEAKHRMRMGTADFNDQKLVRLAGKAAQEAKFLQQTQR